MNPANFSTYNDDEPQPFGFVDHPGRRPDTGIPNWSLQRTHQPPPSIRQPWDATAPWQYEQNLVVSSTHFPAYDTYHQPPLTPLYTTNTYTQAHVHGFRQHDLNDPAISRPWTSGPNQFPPPSANYPGYAPSTFNQYQGYLTPDGSAANNLPVPNNQPYDSPLNARSASQLASEFDKYLVTALRGWPLETRADFTSILKSESKPRNAFLIFRQCLVAQVKEGGTSLYGNDVFKSKGYTLSDYSKYAGSRWQALSPAEKGFWERQAEEEKRLHKEMFPGFKNPSTKKKL